MTNRTYLQFTLLLWGCLQSLVFAQTSSSGQAYTFGNAEDQETVVYCDNLTLESSEDSNTFVFHGNVRITGNNMEATCDKMLVFSSRKTKKGTQEKVGKIGKISKILAVGNVRIEQGGRIAVAGKAQMLPNEDKVILEDSPMVIDGESTVKGYRMVLLKGQRKAIVEGTEGGERPTVTLPALPDLGFEGMDL